MSRPARIRRVLLSCVVAWAVCLTPRPGSAQEPPPDPAGLAPEDDLLGAMFGRAVAQAQWTIEQGLGEHERGARTKLELLALEHFASGDYAASTLTYALLLSLSPDDPMACLWRARIVINSLATDDKALQWQASDELFEYVDTYQSDVYSKATKRRCFDEVRRVSLNMIRTWHAEAAATDDPGVYEWARRAYERHLDGGR